MSERFEVKAVGDLTISTQFFGKSFGHASIKDRNEEIRLSENEVYDLHYVLGRIIAQIDEAKRNG